LTEKNQNFKLTGENYKKFFKVLPTPIYIWRKVKEDLILMDYNEAADTIVNGKMNEFLGIKASEMYKDRRDILNDLYSCADGEVIPSREMLYYYKTLEIKKTLNVSYSCIPPDLVFVHTDDITKQKAAEQSFKESDENYRDTYNRIKLYKDLLTHDINNILQNILASVETYIITDVKQEITDEFIQFSNLIRDEINRGKWLVENVQKLSTLEEIEIKFHPSELFEELNNAKKIIFDTFGNKNISIKIESDYNVVPIQANEYLLDIFKIVMVNAVYHNENLEKEIIIKVSKTEKDTNKFIKFEFIDNGIGIPDAIKKRIFQSDVEKVKITSGTGLGLKLVNKVLEQYKGEIWVENRVEDDYTKGSKFIILIPEVN
jgi:signal transduction histidine kinase